MTVNINLAGLPAVTVPCGWAAAGGEGGANAQGPLPIGMQLIGRPFSEASLLQLAHVFELTNPERARHTLPDAGR